MQRIQNIRSRRLLVDELIRAIQQIEHQSSSGIAEMSSSIQENVDRLKGLIELNKYDDSTVNRNIEQTKKELDLQIKELKQMISDHNRRAEENAHSINQMRSAVEGEIQKLKAQPKVVNQKQEIIQKVDTSTIEEELKRQKENQKVIAEYVKAHQEEQKKSNDQFQASLDRLIAEFLNSQNQPKPEPTELPDYTKQFEQIDNRLLTVEQRGVPARMTPTFAHLEQNYYKKPQVDNLVASSAGAGGGTGTVLGEPRGIAYFAENSALASRADEMRFDFDTNTFLIGTSAALKESKIYAQSNYTGTAPSYGSFLGASWAPGVNTTALVGGLGFTVQTNDNTNFSGQVKGIEGFMFHGGSGYLGQALGASFIVQNNAGGHINAVYGASFAAQNNSVGGQIDVAAALYAGPPSSLGTIILMYGMQVENQGGSGISNAIGIYLKNQTGAAGLNYALYGEGGTVGWNMNGTNSDFQIKGGGGDANAFYLKGSTDRVGFGTSSPVNKVDVSGGMAVGGSYAGVKTAPTNGILSQGTVSIGTTDFSSIPGATAQTWSVVSKIDGDRGGYYFRNIQTADNQMTIGNYNLISSKGSPVINSAGFNNILIGTQNEAYAQDTGNTNSYDDATGTFNFMEANGAYARLKGTNNILLVNQSSGQNIATVNTILVSGANGTTVGDYFVMADYNSASTSLMAGAAYAMTWKSPTETVNAINIDTNGIGTVNDPSQRQVGIYINWNIPGTDANFAKWAMYVNSTNTDSSRTYFGDTVMMNKKPYITTGTNKPIGSVTLTGGTANVSANIVTNSTVIIATVQTPGGTVGSVYVAGRTAGTGFTLTSTSGTDTSNVGYMMYEMTP